MVELLVVVGLLLLLLAVGISQFRHGSQGVMKVAADLTFHMEMRSAVDKLTESLLEGNEVVKPSEGGTLSFLVVKDVVNHICVLYLERAERKEDRPFNLAMFTDDFSGAFDPKRRKVLFGSVKSVSFTTVSPALVVAKLIMVNPAGKELPAILEIPLKNLGTVDD